MAGINRTRAINGEYSTLFPIIRKDPARFMKYMRMDISTFDYILSKINSSLMKNWCNLHTQPIFPEERLVLTLRFLATGNTFSDLAFSFRMGVKTVSSIILETMDVLWSSLRPLHMSVPSVDEFIRISMDFETKWSFPHCIGSIDGRHVAIKKPPNSGNLYFNFKKYYSIVLQALVDANYRYICIDVGGFGRQHDSSTFKASQLYKALMQKKMRIPDSSKLINCNLYLPYFFIGDGAYPLSEMLMKPYRGNNLLHKEIVFNKQLSKARVVVENAFAQTSQKWRILYTSIDKSVEVVNLIIKCTCLLHNIIIDIERKNCTHNANVSHSTYLRVDDVLIAPVRGEDIRNEIANYFMINHKCRGCLNL